MTAARVRYMESGGRKVRLERLEDCKMVRLIIGTRKKIVRFHEDRGSVKVGNKHSMSCIMIIQEAHSSVMLRNRLESKGRGSHD